MTTLALDVSNSKVTAAVFERDNLVARELIPNPGYGGPDYVLERLADAVGKLRSQYTFSRCGIGFGGPVDFTAQRVALSTHIEGWGQVDLVRLCRDLAEAPVVIDNDANAGALGEAQYGAGRGCDPLFYMTLSTGIGGGIVAGGEVLRGADSYAGELGHHTLKADGPECLCGARGCFERLCCGYWLERDHGRSASELLRDPLFVERYVVDLAQGMKTAIMLLNPAKIVIGGGIAKAGERLFGPLRAELRRQITSWSRARIEVEPAALGDDSVVYGALALARKVIP